MKKSNITIGQQYEVQFVDYTHDGLGVAKVDNFPIFVANALQGEQALIEITTMKKNIGFGKIVKLHEPSKQRVTPMCTHYPQCGGCNLMHLNYNEQLKFKTEHTKSVISRIGKLDTKVNDCVGTTKTEYRNKVIVPIQYKEEVHAGFYISGTNEIVDLDVCYVQPKVTTDILHSLKSNIQKYSIPNIRCIFFRVNSDLSQVMVGIVTLDKKSLDKSPIIDEIIEQYPSIVSIIQIYNTKPGNVMLTPDHKVIHGKDYIEDELLGNKYRISYLSFYQINRFQTEKLYQQAIDYANLKSTDTVLDAYCGIGTIGLSFAKNIQKLYGIEVIEEAVKNARQNAKLNHIDNTEFFVGKAEGLTEQFENIHLDCVFVDPPRKGCDEKFLDFLSLKKPKKVVYISCNPSTQARDLRYLEDNGYTVQEITPFDMFPQTHHTETVALLTIK